MAQPLTGSARAPEPPSLHPTLLDRSPAIDSKVLAASIARIADELKGLDIKIYDVSETLRVADYFVVVTGNSRPHVKALYEEIHYRLKHLGERHARAEGLELGWWVLLDFGDVVVHLQQEEARAYYALDALYGDCPQLAWQAIATPALPSTR